jgi:hypothetical protein
MLKRIATLLFVSFCLIQVSSAQRKEFKFKTDPLEFQDDVKKYFKKEQNKDGEKVAKKFAELWELKSFTNDQEDDIMRFSNNLITTRFLASDFAMYYQALINFTNNAFEPKDFKEWQATLDSLFKAGSSRDLSNYVEITKDFFRDLSLSDKTGTKWYLTDRTFEFVYDTTAKIICEDVDIICIARNDRTGIYKTTGEYHPLRRYWYGQGGTVNWARGGLDSTQVYAEINDYQINMSNANFNADSVTFHYKTLLERPLMGDFEDKLTTNYKPENATYPKFTSYEKTIKKDDIFKNINYEGGLKMSGGRFIGFGEEGADAKLNFYTGDTLALRTYSKAYVFYSDRISAEESEVSFYLGGDSLYHPKVSIKFLADTRTISLIRQGTGIRNTLFFDSFHEMAIDIETLNWNIDTRTAELGQIISQNKPEAYFESTNYYRQQIFNKTQGLQSYNPLVEIMMLKRAFKEKPIFAKDYAARRNLTVDQVRGQLRKLVEGGFIYFDEDFDLITVKDKAINYVQNNAGNVDYDILRIRSRTDSANAYLNMKNYNLVINGVRQITMSDSQSVYVVPYGRTLTVMGNRNMLFGGQVHAGTLDFYGKGFTFDYENFKIALQNIDSLKIKVIGTSDAQGARQLIDVETVLQNINGDLYIDDKDNKSGLKDYPQYPLFDSQKESFVYYDYPNIQQSNYDRDRFFFRVIPFQLDSLDALTSTNGLAFPGIFYSGGIFPDLKEVLSLQSDTSLGFISPTPQGGYPLYKGKGNYEGNINLSQHGLFGQGDITYLSSKGQSQNILFLLDSVKADIDRYEIKKGPFGAASYPGVVSEGSYMHWEPYADSMRIDQKTTAFDIYGDKATYEGSILYTPANLYGSGKIGFNNAQVASRSFLLKENSFRADTSNMNVYNQDSTKHLLAANNIKSEVDFGTMQGKFESNLFGYNIEYPNNKYVGSLNRFTWDIKKKEMEFSAALGQVTEELSFRSTDPKQDSLVFASETAKFFLDSSAIGVSNVPNIFVADVEIIPDKNEAYIAEGGKLGLLKNARIIANTDTRFHEIFNANLNITGKNKFSGSGEYEYVSKGGAIEKFKFERILVDTAGRTQARGRIADTTTFVLNPRILFKGEVVLKAEDKYMNYEGYAKLDQQSTRIKSEFFSFAAEVNPDSLVTTISDPRDINKKRLFTGFHINNMTGGLYGTFVSQKVEPNDHDIIKVEGQMLFDEDDQIFKIGSETKLFNTGNKGNYLSFDDRREEIFAEGVLDIGIELNPIDDLPKVKTVGTITNDLFEETFFLDILMAFDFDFPKKALEIMKDQLEIDLLNSDVVINDRDVFVHGISEMLPEKEAKTIIEDVKLYGNFKMIKALEHSLFFNRLNFVWDQTAKAYVSEGIIGLGVVQDKLINRRIKGKVVIEIKRGAPKISFYLESPIENWYYFSFYKGLMEAYSSNEDFNQAVLDKTKSDKPFSVATGRKKSDFLRKFPILD